MKHLFIGLELPASIQETLTRLTPRVSGLWWTPAHQMHLTLSFLGDVDRASEGRLRAILAEVHVPAFLLPVQGIGVFGGEWPSVVWAGVSKGHPELFTLHQQVRDAVLRAGLGADLKPFHPHITICRARGIARATIEPFLNKYADAEFGLWKVTGFTLYSSVLAPEGATHTAEWQRVFTC